MNISGLIHKQPGQAQLLIIDVRADEKPFLAGVLIGDLRANPPTTSEVGNECLRRLTAAQDASSNNNAVYIVEVLTPEKANKKVIEVASKVGRHDAVAFFCANEATYEAVYRALNIRI